MAKIKKGIMGPLIGKLGPLVGSSWKGIPYVREYSVSDEHLKQSGVRIGMIEATLVGPLDDLKGLIKVFSS